MRLVDLRAAGSSVGSTVLAARVCALAAATAATIASSTACHAEMPASSPFPMYCVPGITSARCRGTFWETGQLYQKGQEGGALSVEEYQAALRRIGKLKNLILSLREFADRGDVAQVGEVAAQARKELRKVGERTCRSLAGDERIDSEQLLFRVLRNLDDLDVSTLNAAADSQKSGQLPPGFSRVSLLLTQAAASFDEFVKFLPPMPDPDA